MGVDIVKSMRQHGDHANADAVEALLKKLQGGDEQAQQFTKVTDPKDLEQGKLEGWEEATRQRNELEYYMGLKN